MTASKATGERAKGLFRWLRLLRMNGLWKNICGIVMHLGKLLQVSPRSTVCVGKPFGGESRSINKRSISKLRKSSVRQFQVLSRNVRTQTYTGPLGKRT